MPEDSLIAPGRPPNKPLRTNESPFSAPVCQSPPASLRLRLGVVRVSSGRLKFGVSRVSARAAPAAGELRAAGRSGAGPCGAGWNRAGPAAPAAPAAPRTRAQLQTPPEFAETCDREEAAALITCK